MLTEFLFLGLLCSMASEKKGKKVEWKATQTANMVRRNGGVYYAQVKISGKTYRRSLGTSVLGVARVKLPMVINEIRARAEGTVAFSKSGGSAVGRVDLRACLQEWIEGQRVRPDLKSSTKDYNERRFDDLIKGFVKRGMLDVPAGKVSVLVWREWWADVAGHFNPQYANNLLAVAEGLLGMQEKAGLVSGNVLEDFKRMLIPSKLANVASSEQMTAMITDIRAQASRFAEESADMVALMAYTGMRPGEMLRLQAEDLLEDFIAVRMGEGEGTKNYEERMIPIMSQVVDVVVRRRVMKGGLWSIKDPSNAMRRSCGRLKFGFVVTPYSCRHFFATRCLESGVDVPTVAGWLGHKDGGVTLMKKYSHLCNKHGLEAAKMVNFK